MPASGEGDRDRRGANGRRRESRGGGGGRNSRVFKTMRKLRRKEEQKGKQLQGGKGQE